jgi:hypothetical protein
MKIARALVQVGAELRGPGAHPTGQLPHLTPAAKSLIRRHKGGSLRWREKGSGRGLPTFGART